MSAGVLRRFGAMLYDLLLVIALLVIVTALFLPFTGGEAITPDRSVAVERIYQAALLIVVVLFFCLFWTWRGQTVGMLAWRLRVERSDGTLSHVARCAAAAGRRVRVARRAGIWATSGYGSIVTGWPGTIAGAGRGWW